MDEPDLSQFCQVSEESISDYHWDFINPSSETFSQLTADLHSRLVNGRGEAFYELGVDESGFARGLSPEQISQSLQTINNISKQLSAQVCASVQRKGEVGQVVQLLIRQHNPTAPLHLRVAVCGNVDAGKTTFISVLTRGQTDNGRGSARHHVFRHKHEIDSGRTSSISLQTMGYDSKGQVVNSSDHGLSCEDLINKSSKLLTFIDLAGHEKYLKTTVTGMTGQQPDYAMLLVGANMGLTRITKEHLGIALSLKLPLAVVITKVDIAPANILQNTLQTVVKLLKVSGVRKMPVLIKTINDVMTCVRNTTDSERLCPIFLVSNVSGKNLDLVRAYLNLMPAKRQWTSQDPAEFVIDRDYFVTGVGTVVSGTVISGVVQVNSTLLLGPDSTGAFTSVQIKSIHSERVPMKAVTAGQSATLSLKKIKRNQIRKGMVLVDPSLRPKASREFTLDLLVLLNSTTIKVGYQPVAHCSTVCQTVNLVKISEKEVLRTGDRATVGFRFLNRPEYLKVGSRVILRDGRTKCVGTVTSVS